MVVGQKGNGGKITFNDLCGSENFFLNVINDYPLHSLAASRFDTFGQSHMNAARTEKSPKILIIARDPNLITSFPRRSNREIHDKLCQNRAKPKH